MNSIDIFEAISHCKDLLASCGGHRLAAGLTIEMEHFEAFQKSIWEYAEANLTESDFQPQLRVDMEAPPSRISLAVLDEWDQLQPFGEGNPPPTLFSAGVVVTTSRRMGKDATHLKLQVTHSSADSGWLGDAVGWGRADEWEPMTQPGRTVDMVYMPSINCYNGKRSVQYIVKDLRA
jgi:single-stranded-DNA-specific exonuclease